MFETFYRDEDLVIGLEWKNTIPIIHHHVYSWSPSVYKKMKLQFDNLISQLKEKGYPELYSYFDIDNDKVRKMSKKFGFMEELITPTTVYVVKEL